MKKLASLLLGLGCLAIAGLSTATYTSAQTEPQYQEQCPVAPCTTDTVCNQVPCAPVPCNTDTVCTPVPCNATPCTPAPCTTPQPTTQAQNTTNVCC